MLGQIQVVNGEIQTRNGKGQFHSFNDKPARIRSNGAMYWYKNGKPHRDSKLPAVIFADGNMLWCFKGTLVSTNYC